MENTLGKRSNIYIQKSKFFLYRIVTYFTFFFAPIWILRTVNLEESFQLIILSFYMLFMGGQWYLMGKEIDHRLKIFYRANSSMDRILYRIFLGKIILMLFFNILIFLPTDFLPLSFVLFFGIVGLFYSWPTRGKIIQETVSDQFTEFKYLDGFEKTTLALTAIMFFFTLPEIPFFQNIEALKLYYDPKELLHPIIWNFLNINFLPFMQIQKTYALAWSLHFYIFGLGVCLVSLYGFLRFFFSRRLSLLGVFSLISSWSVVKFLESSFLNVYVGTFIVLWLWSFFFTAKSSTYRSGFFVGLIHFYGTCINVNYFFLFPIYLFISYKYAYPSSTPWFKRQWIKYTLFGFLLSLGAFILHFDISEAYRPSGFMIFEHMVNLVSRKAFFILALIGLPLYFILETKKEIKSLNNFKFESQITKELNVLLMSLCLLYIFLDKLILENIGSMTILVFFSLIPLEWLFQTISRLRSRRNLIYAIYILVCLLDSHFEGRVRVIGKMFLSDHLFKYIQQM